MTRLLPLILLAGSGALAATLAASPDGRATVLPVGLSPTCRISLDSGPAWTVRSVSASGAPGPKLGPARAVCLNSSVPAPCPAGALVFGFPASAGQAWTADRSAIGSAPWIWSPSASPAAAGDLQRFVFERSFELRAEAVGTLLVAVDDFAEVRVNGKRLGAIASVEQVAIASRAQGPLSRFDLSPYLVRGPNTISILAQNGPGTFAGCPGACSYQQNPAGLVVGGDIDACPAATARAEASAAPRVSPAAVASCTSAAQGFAAAARSGRAEGQGWSFGWAPELAGTFTPFRRLRHELAGVADTRGLAFLTPLDVMHPVAFLNPTNDVRYPGGTFTLQPGQLAVHPGPQGELAIARWRARAAGRAQVSVELFGLSGRGHTPATTTDVHVRRAGFDLAAGDLNQNGSGNAFAWADTLDVGPDDPIDIAVGWGNGAYEHDSTALDATVCFTSEAP